MPGEAQTRWLQLAGAAMTGVVPDELIPALQSLLDWALRDRPLAQPVLNGIYLRTPRGQEHATATREVNAALRTLRGQLLLTMHVSHLPGRYTLTVETERVRLTLVLDEAGARVESAEMG